MILLSKDQATTVGLLHEFLGIGSDLFASPSGSFPQRVGSEVHCSDGVESPHDIRFLLGLGEGLIQAAHVW